MRQVWTQAQLRGTWPLAIVGAALVALAGLIAPQTVAPWVLTGALLLLPGLALVRLLVPAGLLTAAERLALALCAGCAVPPLVMEIAWLGDVRLGAVAAWLTLGVCVALLISRRAPQPLPAAERAPLLLLILLTLGTTALRGYAARELPAGMWGDSYHHTMIAELLVEHGGIFDSWLPYAPLTTLTYHFGFHALVAWLTWLGGPSPLLGVLVIGQAQSALAVPAVFLLTRRLTGSDRAAVWAALAAGFLSAMPAYNVNWGRYTQLAGQLLLPAVVVSWSTLLDAALTGAERRTWLRLGALAGVVTGALALTHYRVLAFAACAVAAWWLVQLAIARPRPALLLHAALVALPAALLTGLIGGPWAWHLRNGALLRIGQHFMSINIGTLETNNLPTLADFQAIYSGALALTLSALGLVVLVARQRAALALPLWAAFVAVAANPYLIGLGGAGVLTNNAALIASYLVITPLVGVAAAQLAAMLAPRLGPRLPYLEVTLAGLAIASSIGWQARIVDPRYALLTPADAAAQQWLTQETPADAKIAVNSFPAYGGTLYAGSDGGWWIPLITRRATNLPPITYGTETADPPDFLERVNAMNQQLDGLKFGTPDAARTLRALGFSYIYDGPTSSGLPERFTPQQLAATPGLRKVYARDGVTVWQVE